MRRRLAKALFWISTQLMRIKTPHRVYQVVSINPEAEPFMETERVPGFSWHSCTLSMKFLNASQQLDWDHWDHWACVHEDCDPRPCKCGGLICADDEEPHQVS